MKRIVPALAALILGSGCVVTTDPCEGTMSVSWNSFRDGYNNVWSWCADAGVANVDIYVDSDSGIRVPCGNYSAVISAVEGTHSVVVEGVDANGYILYRDSWGGASVACGMDTPIDSQPAEGRVALYSSYTLGTCGDYYPSWLWFSIVDWATNDVTWNSADSWGTTYPACNYDGEGISLLLPAGSYTMEGVQEMYYSAPTYYVGRRDCMNADFSVAGGLVSYLYASLYDSTFACF